MPNRTCQGTLPCGLLSLILLTKVRWGSRRNGSESTLTLMLLLGGFFDRLDRQQLHAEG